MATYNNGSALTPEEIAQARQWSTGKSASEVAAQAQSLGLTPDQLGAAFGGTGMNATDVGYGSGGLNSQYNNYSFDGNQWKAPSSNLGLGGAATTNIADQYRSMGLSDPSNANARLLSGQVNNQYLDSQANNITSRLNRNLQENILPGIGQGAQMAGQYGGSRQGIAQGKAIGDTQDNLANALTNMYSGANEAAQNRMGAAAGNLSGIGAQVGIANAGQTNAYNLGLMQNATQNKGLDNSYALGQGNLALGNRSADNAYELGKGNLALGNKTADNNYGVGMANVGVAGQNASNNYNLGMAGIDSRNQQFGQQFGLDVLNSQYNWANGGLNASNNMQNTPINYNNQFNQNQNSIGGMGGNTTGTTQMPGNPYLGAVGGLGLANQWLK